MKPTIREAIIVEGRYDRNTVLQAVDAVVVETSGFGVFNDADKLAFIRKLAEKRGVIILTDSDGAGFVIRGHLKGKLSSVNVKHAYIPDIAGKERRKNSASKEGKLGVEGMDREIIITALRNAGASFEEDNTVDITPAFPRSLLFELGLTGGENSAKLRDTLKTRLGLPQRMSAPALFGVLHLFVSEDELRAMLT